MCGFEFITTFLILCEIPLCYAAAKAYFVRRDPHGALVWLGRTVGAGVSALGGVTAALALWFAQEWLCFGSAADAWQNMTRAVTDRVSLTDGAVRDVNMPQVLAQYFRESTEPLLQLGPVSVMAWQLLLFALLIGLGVGLLPYSFIFAALIMFSFVASITTYLTYPAIEARVMRREEGHAAGELYQKLPQQEQPEVQLRSAGLDELRFEDDETEENAEN